MIKLMLFAPCEKVIVGQDSNTSLISVLEHFYVSGEIAGKLPANAGLPFKWQISVLWRREVELDAPITYDASIELIAPNGNVSMSGEIQFLVSNQYFNFRNVLDFPIFPIGQEGIYKLILKYKENGTEKWEQVGEYPLRVVYDIKGLINENKSGDETENKHAVKRVSSVSGTGKKTRVGAKKRHPKKHK